MDRILSTVVLAATLLIAVPVLAHDGHVHEIHDVAVEAAPVIVGFRIDKDPAGGWNVVLDTANFQFAPDDAADAEGNLGHAHLFINGTEFGKLYAPTYHIDELPFGPHDFRVVLNTRARAEYAVQGRAVEARFTLTVE